MPLINHPEPFVEGTFFTPRTYGMAGTNFKGFDVDRLLPPGTNMNELSFTSTKGLLDFDIRRTILNVVLVFVGLYSRFPAAFKDFIHNEFVAWAPSGGASTTSRLMRMLTTIRDFWRFIRSYFPIRRDGADFDQKAQHLEKLQALAKIHRKPRRITAVLVYHRRVAPPPSPPLVVVQLANGEKIHPEATNIEAYDNEVLTYQQLQASHEEQQIDVLTKDAASYIVACAISGVTLLSLYEETGRLASNKKRLNNQVVAACHEYQFNSPTRIHIHVITGGGETVHRRSSSSQRSDPLLNVLLLKQTDTITPILRITHGVAAKIKSGALSCSTLTEKRISTSIRKQLIGSRLSPELFILPSNSNTMGYPLYCLNGAVIL
jgi:hypothetical protein